MYAHTFSVCKLRFFNVQPAPMGQKPHCHLAAHRLEGACGSSGPAGPQKSTISGRPENHVFKTQVYKQKSIGL